MSDGKGHSGCFNEIQKADWCYDFDPGIGTEELCGLRTKIGAVSYRFVGLVSIGLTEASAAVFQLLSTPRNIERKS